MKAKVVNNSGLMLIIPKYSNAPLLFLEWISEFGAAQYIKVINEDDVLKIRLIHCIKENYNDCVDYINNNL